MAVCFECCVLSGRGLCDELTTRPEESYRLWCVVCGLENTSLVNEEEGQGPLGGYSAKRKKKPHYTLHIEIAILKEDVFKSPINKCRKILMEVHFVCSLIYVFLRAVTIYCTYNKADFFSEAYPRFNLIFVFNSCENTSQVLRDISS